MIGAQLAIAYNIEQPGGVNMAQQRVQYAALFLTVVLSLYDEITVCNLVMLSAGLLKPTS